MTEPSKKDAERNANTTEDWRESVKKKATEEYNYYQYMLEHDILTDCTFVVGPEDGETREFNAHRLHIARMSPVFEAMLLRDEMIEAKTGHVRITDLSPTTFNLLLNCIYGKKFKTTSFQEAQDLAYAAHKYQMNALLENCVTRILCALITPDNIWTAIETADLLQNQRMKAMCIQVLQCDTLHCIADKGFLQASEESVALLLKQDELNVDNEQLLVNTVVHWARHAARQRGLSNDDSDVRAVLEPRLLALFRLLAMSPQQFMLGPGLAGWLTDDEKSIISECLKNRDFSKLPQHLSSVAAKRRKVTGMATVNQILDKKSKRNFICKRETIGFRPNAQAINAAENTKRILATLIFKVSSRCSLLGFQFSSRCRADSNEDPTTFLATNPIYDEHVVIRTHVFNHTLSIDFTKTRVGESQRYYQKTEYNSTITIMFEKPRLLRSNNWFAIEVEVIHSNKKCSAEYPNPLRARSVLTAAGVEFVFRTEEQESYHTSTYDGIFENLIFS